MSKRFRIVTVTDEGKSTSRRTVSDAPAAAVLLIALELSLKHRAAGLVDLYTLVERESVAFGRETAFVDEDRTYVVTWLGRA